MIELEKSPRAYRLRDGAWEFSFRFAGDRWQHTLAVRQGDAWLAMLTSDEGRPNDEPLRTPVFQDLRCEEPGPGIVEFQLMGQSGPGVYSGAVRYSAADRTLDFDLCGRARSGTVGLCTFTTYQLGDADCRPFVKISETEASSAELKLASGMLIRIDPVPIAGSPAGECRIDGDEGARRLIVGCFERAQPDSRQKPANIRWRYRITASGQP